MLAVTISITRGLYVEAIKPKKSFLFWANSTDVENQELKRFPSLQADIAAAATEALERFREEGRKTVLRLVEMESTYLTVEFFRKLSLEPENTPNPNNTAPNMDRYTENHLRRIGKTHCSAYLFQHVQC